MHTTTAEKDAYLVSQKSMLRGEKKLQYIHTSREKKSRCMKGLQKIVPAPNHSLLPLFPRLRLVIT